MEWFVSFAVGGVRVVENAAFDLRGARIPVIDRLGGGRPAPSGDPADARLLVVRAAWAGGNGKEYAVRADGLGRDALFAARPGTSVAPRAAFARESWEAADGGRMDFVDWPALARR